MMSREGKEDIMGLKDALRGVLNGRTCQNWAVLLLCVKQVSFTKTGIIIHTNTMMRIAIYLLTVTCTSLG